MEQNGRLLNPDQEDRIKYLTEQGRTSAIRRRAQILLGFQDGNDARSIAQKVQLSPKTVRHWRREFLKKGMEIFPDNAMRAAVYRVPGTDITPKDTVQAEEKMETAFAALEHEAQPEAAKQEIPFPQPQESAGLQVMDSMAEAGRKILLYNFAEMLSHETGTLIGEDPDELHDMRVATRRMRAAFRVFSDYFKPKAVKSFTRDIKTLAGALGDARDMDVLLNKTQDYLDTLPEADRAGLAPLLSDWGQKKDRTHAFLVDYLNSLEYQKFKRRFNVFVQTPGKGVADVSTNPPQPNLVRDVVPLIIYERMTSVRSYETILESASLEQLHRLRIEFKRLRYAIEFFKELLGDEVKHVISQLKEVQDHLGDLQDARVACQMIDQVLIDWEPQQSSLPLSERQSPQPIVTFLGARLAERHTLMMSFPETWAKFNSPDFRQKLALAVAAL